jgi:two-component system NtrC family sensor kinase
MPDSVHLLVVDDDPDLLALLAQSAQAHGYRVATASSLAETAAALDRGPLQVALVDLVLGSESGLDVVRRIKARAPDVEIIVISGTTSVASAIASYELDAFAFVPKPFDLDQLFAKVARAVEHRRMNQANRRLVWELQLINDIGDDLRGSLDPRDLLGRALQRLIQVLDASGASARLMNPHTGGFDEAAFVGPRDIRMLWTDGTAALVPRPSDRVLETRGAVIIGDLADLVAEDVAAALPIRSAVSVPMFAGAELVGTLSMGSTSPYRFSRADVRLLAIIANQIGVAVQNARLASFAQLGKRQWEATFDAIGDPIAVFDGQGRLLRGNTALAAHLGRPVTALNGLRCDAVGLCGGTYPACAVGRAATSECARDDVTLPDERIFSVTTCPVPGISDGAVVQIAKNVTAEIGSARRLRQMSDELAGTNARLLATVDRLKTTQAQLLQAEKLSAIGQLVAGVAHELNNPLTSVIGYAQLVEDELRSAAPDQLLRPGVDVARDVRRIAEESERAAKIVRNLLAFARRQTAERAPQDVADLFNRVLALRSYEFRLSAIDLEATFEAELPRVLADAGQLQQALLNLVLNAEQAMRGRAPRRLRVAARYVDESAAVELSIADSGHGISEENLRRIFDPFFTTRDVGEGTGLGLSIVYGIVRDHGGQVRVESRVGSGATFFVTLPARRAAAIETAKLVMVAHADSTERDYIAAMLAGWGHKAVAVESSDAASRLRAAPFDAAFVDQALIAADPAAWKAARAAGGGQTALVLMTSTDEDDSSRGWRREAGAVLAPPYELRALRAALRAVSKEYA